MTPAEQGIWAARQEARESTWTRCRFCGERTGGNPSGYCNDCEAAVMTVYAHELIHADDEGYDDDEQQPY